MVQLLLALPSGVYILKAKTILEYQNGKLLVILLLSAIRNSAVVSAKHKTIKTILLHFCVSTVALALVRALYSVLMVTIGEQETKVIEQATICNHNGKILLNPTQWAPKISIYSQTKTINTRVISYVGAS